jgi:hypothetical protein
MSAPLGFTPAARFLIVAAAFVVVVAGMKSASDLVTPFLLSVFIAVLASPPLQYLRSLGLPYWAAMLIIVAVLVAVGGGLGALFTGSLTTFNDNLTNYQARLRTLSSELLRWLDGIGLPIPREALNSALDPSRALALAGLYEHWRGDDGETIDSFVILTTRANEQVRSLHDRMPVVLAPECWPPWLDVEHVNAKAASGMLGPCPASTLAMHPVSRRVNRPGVDEPSLIEPIQRQGGMFE